MTSKDMTINKEEIIRYHQDEESGDFYFSIVDIIDQLEVSQDPRNYWKVLKNRLKNSQNKLVTECNQLKMKASDDKYYLTDVAKISIVLQIIQIISPEKVAFFEEIFNNIERKNSKNNLNSFNKESTAKKISTVFSEEKEISIDMYKKDNCIYILSLIPGVNPPDIFVSLNTKILTLKFTRQKISNQWDQTQGFELDDYLIQELSYGKFFKTIPLPFEVDIDRVETNLFYGLLSIKLFILDKTRTKIVNVK